MANTKKAIPKSIENEQSEIDQFNQDSNPDISQVATSSKLEGDELDDRLDQLGSIIWNGIELIEAGINLGVTVANRLSTAIQEQTIAKVDRANQPFAETYSEPYQDSSRMGPQYTPSAQSLEPPTQVNYVTNRLYLFPGHPVEVSFTINNDSVNSPREIHLRVEGFKGEVHGAQLNGADFAINPDKKEIAPMDFDKFTLVGNIPQDIPADTYCGWIIVSSDEELRIPVRLLVSPLQQ